jgi:hypothetical protein
MIILHGTRLYGKVDQVPGLFHVATQFFYLQYLPLIPLGSYLVLHGTEKDDGGFSGRKLRLSGNSVLFAYMRLGLFIAGCVLAFLSFLFVIEGLDKPGRVDWSSITGLAFSSVALFLLFWGSYRVTHAGATRALQLARIIGVPPETVASHFADKLKQADLEALAEQLQGAGDSADPDSTKVESF